MELNVILNRNFQNIIGINNDLLVNIKEDLINFKKITGSHKDNVIIMGFNTWKSLPNKHLPNRINIVITENNIIEIDTDKVSAFSSFESALDYVKKISYNKIFIIGGSKLYNYIFQNYENHINIIYETLTDTYYDIQEGDNVIYCNYQIKDNIFTKIKQEEHYGKCKVYGNLKQIESKYTFNTYQNNELYNKNEKEYLNLLKKIKENGILKGSRNSQVISSFGERMVFDLRKGFPLLTTKKMGWKTILRELLWFIKGSTNNKELQDKKVHIWDANASKEFMDSRGLTYEEGDLGPIYGFQWRHFGDVYKGISFNHTGGVDQLANVIQLIKEEPLSRRIIMSAWNPSDLDKMALPPCHIMVQFFVDVNDNSIDAQLYQRSGDMFLGVPFNISSYSFLLHIICKITNYKPRYLYHIIGDAHIYESHFDAVEKQLKREPLKLPKLVIHKEIESIDEIDEAIFTIEDYQFHPSIKSVMVA